MRDGPPRLTVRPTTDDDWKQEGTVIRSASSSCLQAYNFPASMPHTGGTTKTTAPERPAGPFFSQSLASIVREKQPSQHAHFSPEVLQLCSTPAFGSFVGDAGFEYLIFEPNPYATAGSVIYDRFAEACKSLPEDANLAIAFHGTRKDIIPIVLKEGLDPKKRKKQVYGPGEYVFVRISSGLVVLIKSYTSHLTSMSSFVFRYFSTDLRVATTYTPRADISNEDGGKMLVFLVVKPFPPAAVLDSTGQVQAKAARFCPIDFIVVPTTDHQLPLGVLSYRKVQNEVLARAVYSSMTQSSNSKMAKQHDSTTTADVMVDVAVDDAVIAPKRTFVSFVIVFAGVLLLA